MKLLVYTLLLDGMPFLPMQYDLLSRLKCDRYWYVLHGAAMNNDSTSWCAPQEPRLSNDGSTEFLVDNEPPCETTIIHRKQWKSKDEMVAAVTDEIKEPCILFQLDVDEFYQPETIDRIVALFGDRTIGAIRLPCRFWVGENLVCEGSNRWSNWPNEWERFWRWEPGMTMLRHEPPTPENYLGRIMERGEAKQHALCFEHKAYVTDAQVRFKESYYNYQGLHQQWLSLQANDKWPISLSRFFSHVTGNLPMVVKV